MDNKRKSGYAAYEGPPSKRYFIIMFSTNNSLEIAAISERNSNGVVFTLFIDDLAKKLVEKYGNRRKTFILTWDGARYHSTSTVKDKINDFGTI